MHFDFNPNWLWWIPALPFCGFLLNGTAGRQLPRAAVSAIALLFTAMPAAIVAWLWMGLLASDAPLALTVASRPWIAVTGLTINFAFAVDHLTLIMLSVVTGVGFLIHIYSAGYMAHEDGYWRFFAYLNLFMFFMLVLVLAANFLLLFVGWEGVGLASYLLIGFYFEKDSAANAGKKAFVVNRIGDFGFLLAMFLLIAHFGSLSFGDVFAKVAALPHGISGGFLTAICLLLAVGAAGKSAQIPLYVWLPDAMEGPTPVSALIHAATMVTAGVYMLARCHTLFDRSPFAMTVVACVGAATAIFAATIGLVQNDIKRVLAYSTVSQLGYMVLACGVGAYSAGVFHLMTHAFFKALLFLSAGSVIHALSGEQDMRKMGGLRKRIPITFLCMTIGVFAIAGMPGLSGFFSKDEILYQVFTAHIRGAVVLWIVGVTTSLLTSFYMFRLWFKTFFGKPRFVEAGHSVMPRYDAAAHSRSGTALELKAEHEEAQTGHAHGVHESPLVMTVPLMILAVLSAVGGYIGVPIAFGGHNNFERFLDPVFSVNGGQPLAEPSASRGTAFELTAVAVACFLVGLLVAYQMYGRRTDSARAASRESGPLYRVLAAKFWVDEVYALGLVNPLLLMSRLGLGGLVEGGVVQGANSLIAGAANGMGAVTRRMQSGNIRSYAGWLALGAAAVIALVFWGGRGVHF